MTRKLIILAILAGCVFLFCPKACSAGEPIPKTTVKEHIVKHSIELGVDPALALSLAKHESGFCHELKSPYGAVGVFQILPSTAKKLGYNAYYLSDNIKSGLKYYLMMYKQFGSMELALAAYNAGPGNVARYNGMPPFKETKIFVNQIMAEYRNLKKNPDPIIVKYNTKNVSNVSKQKVSEPKNEVKPKQNNETNGNESKNSNDLLSLIID